MESTWSQVQSICDPAIDTAAAAPVTALSWDPYFELLWVGNDAGRVTSYYGKGLQRYTSFKAHKNEQIRQIRMTDRGIISISPKSVQMRDRRGLVRFNIRNEQTKDLHCMTTKTLTNNSELLVAGQQEEMLVINMARGAITSTVPDSSNIVVMRNMARSICCGSLAGEVTMRDTRTMRVEQRIQAHTATLSDLDVSGNILVTCGFSQRQNSLVIDPLVKVYDVRMAARSLAPIPFPSGPMFLRMHPTLSTTCLVASQSGQFQMCDVSSLAMGSYAPPAQFFQIQSSSYITAMDMSSSAQTLAFGDGASFVYQFADTENFDINPYSMPLTTPDVVPEPSVTMTDDSPLSSVGMPYYTEPLLSTWTARSIFEAGCPPPQLDDEMLRSMKRIDFVGYAPNPGNMRRNQAPKKKRTTKEKRDVPKFRSEQERELLSSSNVILDEHGELHHSGRRSSSVGDLQITDPLALTMPKHYQRVEIQYSKFGVEDFDFGYYNRTKYGGLETHIRNSYCNSLLQMLFFVTPLRQVAISHIKTSCPREHCLLCELGFLFRMLEDSKGQNCQATNFLRVFSTFPQAQILGLLEPETPDRTTSYSTMIQTFTRFLLEELHQETDHSTGNLEISAALCLDQESSSSAAATTESRPNVVPSVIQQIFGLQTLNHSRCSGCGHELERITYPFVIDMLYPKKDQKMRKRSFTSILKGSMYRENQTKAWCVNCRQYQPMSIRKVIQALPPSLLINSGAFKSEDMVMWRQNGPNMPNKKQSGDAGSQESDSGTDNTSTQQSSWVPERFGVYINGSEIVLKALPRGKEIPAEFKQSPKICAIYELSSTILQINGEEDESHLVAQVKVADETQEVEDKSPWYVFNDFLVRRIRKEEVFSFKGVWKTPCVLQYRRVDADEILDMSPLPSEVDYSLLFEDRSVAMNPPENPLHRVLTPEEMPRKGTLVAIDAEFVALNQEETEIRSDGTKSLIRPSTLMLARVSVIRGEGPDEGVPFIDDYISSTEKVVDYLTEFSGIHAEDIDPSTTKHTLVPLKVAYKKLRMLLDLGCIFIGHGLAKDFRTINILVPPEQIIDTVDIYHIRNRHRKISLRFLAWHLLHQNIQSEGHDSIEDAETALILYKKYLKYREQGRFGHVLEEIYEAGHRANWLKGTRETLSRTSSAILSPHPSRPSS